MINFPNKKIISILTAVVLFGSVLLASPAYAQTLICVDNDDCSATCSGSGFDVEVNGWLLGCDSAGENCDGNESQFLSTDESGAFTDVVFSPSAIPDQCDGENCVSIGVYSDWEGIPFTLLDYQSFDWESSCSDGDTLTAENVADLQSGLISELVDQMTTNLPDILAFVAGILMLLLGIRWVKRAVRK